VKPPHYILFCFAAVIVGCPAGAVWFELALAAKESGYQPFALFPLTLFDSFLFGWFPALLFGAILHFWMQKMRWTLLWQWVLSDGLLA
jgi:hypothetical protein